MSEDKAALIDPNNLPAHVGIIMDGNGRWAKNRGLIRSKGHREGLESAKRIVKAAADLGLKYISLYVFSTENWKRAEDEISFLMVLIKTYLKSEFQFYKDNKIKVVHSGDLSGLPADIQKEITSIVNDTKDFQGLTMNLLINYGGKDEILRAVNRWRRSGDTGELTEETLYGFLDSPVVPPLDLVVRSAGEKRLSNFLLWQSAYAEYYFSEKLWPDWYPDDLYDAIIAYQNRDRRFGGVKK
ncbi:polyprenyl diphosphate synthase [Spirochaeta isovalerica]|uniref:Isoprenyl transferase n=1 Tax=Spirochaeta isovalerica TaxID=150 RepID=A0A841R7R3_9SPIO|nr:polyprenyl diphosphate synthase [Spirochaeta isovalerica]MBB6481314.1 undecaprenyl diphosphate synthase [Spirochaeta isovalerica]